MANIYPVDRRFNVTQADHGNIIVLGDTGGIHVGAWLVHWVPGGAFTGQLFVVGRAYGKPASDDVVGFVSLPYRKGYLNGALADWGMVVDGTALSGPSIITVPAPGISIGLEVSNPDPGSNGILYSWPLHGTSIV